MIIKLNTDVSLLKVGKVYKLEFDIDDDKISIPKALVKSINTETTEVEIEPLVEKIVNNEEELNKLCSINLLDKDGNLLFTGH